MVCLSGYENFILHPNTLALMVLLANGGFRTTVRTVESQTMLLASVWTVVLLVSVCTYSSAPSVSSNFRAPSLSVYSSAPSLSMYSSAPGRSSNITLASVCAVVLLASVCTVVLLVKTRLFGFLRYYNPSRNFSKNLFT